MPTSRSEIIIDATLPEGFEPSPGREAVRLSGEYLVLAAHRNLQPYDTRVCRGPRLSLFRSNYSFMIILPEQ